MKPNCPIIISNIFTAIVFGTIPAFMFFSMDQISVIVGYIASLEIQAYFIKLFFIGTAIKIIHGFFIGNFNWKKTYFFDSYNQLITGASSIALIMGGACLGILPFAIQAEEFHTVFICVVILITFPLFSVFINIRVANREIVITKDELHTFRRRVVELSIKVKNVFTEAYNKHITKK